MRVSRISAASGKLHVMDLPITDEQWEKYQAGAYVQDAFPHLSPSQREFIISGTTPEEWDELFSKEDQ